MDLNQLDKNQGFKSNGRTFVAARASAMNRDERLVIHAAKDSISSAGTRTAAARVNQHEHVGKTPAASGKRNEVGSGSVRLPMECRSRRRLNGAMTAEADEISVGGKEIIKREFDFASAGSDQLNLA